MKIGITFDLKSDTPAPPPRGGAFHSSITCPGGVGGLPPDDLQEEFDSPVTIAAIGNVLRGLGHEVVELGDGREMLQRLLADPPDFVFNLAEGQGIGRSREARVPAVLEMLGIPYSGSDPFALALTLVKDTAKNLAFINSVPSPASITVESNQRNITKADLDTIEFPVIVKPAWEGSSKGIRKHCLVERFEDLMPVVESVRRDHRQPVVVEEFIAGPEVTVGVIGNDPPRVFGMLQVVPIQPTERFIYSLEVKRDYKRQVRYEVPPKVSARAIRFLEEAALNAFQGLGCRDVARVDFRLDDDMPLFLEINPLPGLHPDDSDLVYIAKGVGWSYERLIRTIVDAAFKRYGIA